MQWLARICVQRPVFATVLMLVIVVFGVAGYGKLGVDEFPNIDFPAVVVTTRLPGAAPEEVESDVSDKIERVLNTISGIDELRSVSSEGVSQVIVMFKLERAIDAAAQDVRDKINTVLPELPAGIDPPVVTKIDPDAAPILLVSLRSNRPVREVTEMADKQVRRQIESILGVGQVAIIGGRSRQVHVWLDPLALEARRLSPADVQRAIASQNLTTPGGSLDTGPQSITVRVDGRVTSPEAIGRLVIRDDGVAPVRVEDVARIEDGEEEERSFAAIDREQTVLLAVRKQSGQNTVAVVDSVKEKLGAIQKSLPEGTKLEVVRDNSGTIRTGIESVVEHLIVGSILAALVVLLFLGNVRSTIITALSIPISIIGTFGLMWARGFTLNFLTLLALALAVGIVIDDAIVVLENIVRYVEEKKVKPFPAAVRATKEIGLAVLATTLSLIAVFVPVAFMPGIPGRFLSSFGITMAFAIGVSLIVSFTLTPALAARWLSPPADHPKETILTRVVDGFYRPIERVYMRMLTFCMRKRWIVVVLSGLTLGSCVPLAKSLPGGFIPQDDRAQFEMNIRAPEGSSVTETRLLAERMADDVRKLPGVVNTLLTVGEDAKESSNLAKVYVFLTDPKTREETQFQLMDRVRKEIFAHAPKTLRLSVGEVQAISLGSSSASVQYSLSGPDLDQLGTYASHITEKLRAAKAAVDVDNTFIVGKPEVRVRVDRDRASALGVRVADVADTLRVMVAGLKVSTFAEGGEEYDVRVRADARFRVSAESLALASVPSSRGGPVPLANVVTLDPGEGPSEINRLNRQRQITIMANAAPGFGEAAVEAELKRIVAEENLAPGYELTPIGRSKESARLQKGFLLVMGLAFVFMYLILAAQFESWLHPITILLALPLTVPFALTSLHLFGQSLNIFSGLGLLVLFGVVKKNSILQVDHTNQLRARGLPRLQAILDANRDRLRPILMTTLAFVVGMVPLILSRGTGSGNNRAIAGVVLGGQTLSLLLTLLAVPVAYSLFDDVALWLSRVFFGRKAPVDRGEAELAADAHEEPLPAPGE
jgi:hydrophobe/amphiphile efflux-1 (HAE1) family protein